MTIPFRANPARKFHQKLSQAIRGTFGPRHLLNNKPAHQLTIQITDQKTSSASLFLKWLKSTRKSTTTKRIAKAAKLTLRKSLLGTSHAGYFNNIFGYFSVKLFFC